MKVIYLLAALLLSAAVVILLGLSPQRITDDIMSLLHRDRSLKYKVLVTQGKIKKSRMQRMIDNITNALAATHSQNKFSLLITAAVVGGVVGVLLGALFNNLLISVVLIAAAFVIPYVYVKLLLSSYKAHIAEELETALSIITTNYISNGDIAYAVRQGSTYIGVTIFVMIMVMMLMFIITVAPVFLTKMTLNNYANELCREAEIAGRVGSETTARLERLNETSGITPTVVWSKNGKIQIGDTFTVTVSTQVDLSFFVFTGHPITITSSANGISEVYWKNA